jgi:hypothetical protein
LAGLAIAVTAADPLKLRKSRRENPVMATLPLIYFYGGMMRPDPTSRKTICIAHIPLAQK